jgi:hypothetical protein
VTSFLQVFKSNFHISFSLSLRGACHSNLTFLWSNLCYIWKESWSYESASYEISLDPSPNISLNIVFWHSQCMFSWWKRTIFTLIQKSHRFVLSYILISRLLYVIRIENILNFSIAVIFKTYSDLKFFFLMTTSLFFEGFISYSPLSFYPAVWRRHTDIELIFNHVIHSTLLVRN